MTDGTTLDAAASSSAATVAVVVIAAMAAKKEASAEIALSFTNLKHSSQLSLSQRFLVFFS
jgi:hypothetical protein